MFRQSTLIFAAASCIPAVLAGCTYYADGSYTCTTWTFSPGAWFGVAFAIFALIVCIGACIRYQRRKQANVANMSYVRHAQEQAQAANQAQWNAQQQAYAPAYAPPTAGYDASPMTPGTTPGTGAYEPPKGPPPTFPMSPGETPYNPQYPPPTYARA